MRLAARALIGAMLLLLSAGLPGAPVESLVFLALRSLPHPGPVFTQGLVYHQGRLYESAGASGIHPRSSLRILDAETGAVIRSAYPPRSEVFAEGLALRGGVLIQLTWKDGKVFRYDAETLAPKGSWMLEGEGWGLAPYQDGFVMSDGSAWLSFRDGRTFSELRRRKVTLEGEPLRNLNELEAGPGGIWANVWHENFVVRIDPASGEVTAVVDASPLVRAVSRPHGEAVLNGLAWNAEKNVWFVTGKDWPVIFEARVVPRPPSSRGSR
jgi:glutamine cyclotransferase